jgi:mono/diheme cytochrome c family protein
MAVLLATALGGAAPAGAYTPEVEFALNCQGCHRADGTGTPGTVPTLAGSVARFLAVPGGRAYLVQVPGVAQAPLDDAALAAVINWMLARYDAAHLPKAWTPYTADEVGRLRQKPLVDVDKVRASLMAEIERDITRSLINRPNEDARLDH